MQQQHEPTTPAMEDRQARKDRKGCRIGVGTPRHRRLAKESSSETPTMLAADGAARQPRRDTRHRILRTQQPDKNADQFRHQPTGERTRSQFGDRRPQCKREITDKPVAKQRMPMIAEQQRCMSTTPENTTQGIRVGSRIRTQVLADVTQPCRIRQATRSRAVIRCDCRLARALVDDL